jgi:hypothetical protein
MNLSLARYREDCKTYEDQWSTLDQTLYDLCHRCPKHDRIDWVNAKLWIIGRTYATQIERQIPSDGSQGEAMTKLARLLHSRHDEIDGLLATLGTIKAPLSIEALPVILSAHRQLSAIVERTTREGRMPHSFVSKYLHFHCPFVPIYDSVALRALRKLVPAKSLPHAGEPSADADPVYAGYVSRFIVVYARLRDLGVRPTVKLVDNHLCCEAGRL